MKKIITLACLLAAGLSACVEDNVYVGPATIESVAHAPSAITPTDAITVTATIVDLQGVTSAKIQYKVDAGALTTVAMTAAGNTYTGTIPQQADGANVVYYVEVVNKAGITTKSPEKNYTVGAAPLDYANLVLNEIDGNSKAIELFNKGAVALPLDGVSLIKNNGSSSWWTGTAASGSIAPGGYVVIIQDNAANPHLSGGAGISPTQNLKYELKDPDGVSLGIFLRGDESALSAGISDTAPNSYQRCPNGTGDWKLAPSTNGAANPSTGTDIPQS
ncbi:MAG: lamin tail domain-containing protein [Odoribacteraceae bacterium]|jgi:hypothetical protein|nr:lamin tail domain-containing protein [Odoribacteraceae bacterium]